MDIMAPFMVFPATHPAFAGNSLCKKRFMAGLVQLEMGRGRVLAFWSAKLRSFKPDSTLEVQLASKDPFAVENNLGKFRNVG